MTEGQRTPGRALQTGVQHTTRSIVGAVSIVIVPVEHRREVNAQLVVAHPTDVIKQIVVSGEAETRSTVEAITFVAILTIVTGHILELRTNTPADGEIKTAQRVARLRILFQDRDFRLGGESR